MLLGALLLGIFTLTTHSRPLPRQFLTSQSLKPKLPLYSYILILPPSPCFVFSLSHFFSLIFSSYWIILSLPPLPLPPPLPRYAP